MKALTGPETLAVLHLVLTSACQCACIGLLPHRRKKTWELIEALTGPGSPRSPRAHHAPTRSLGGRNSLFADEGVLGLPAPPRHGRCTRSAGALAPCLGPKTSRGALLAGTEDVGICPTGSLGSHISLLADEGQNPKILKTPTRTCRACPCRCVPAAARAALVRSSMRYTA